MTDDRIIALLKCMMLAARRGGDEIMKRYRADIDVRIKDDRTPVTDADMASSEAIMSTLSESFPGAYILCEETYVSDDFAARCTPNGVFIVDPLDGTRSFIAGRDTFAVSISYALGHESIAAVIFAPVSKKLYYAATGRGAWRCICDTESIPEPFERSSERLHVSDRSESLIVLVSGTDDGVVHLRELGASLERVEKFIHVSSCLKGCMIAEGTADVHYKFAGYTKEWDTSGEELICREAGGVVTDAFGVKLKANREDIVNRRGIRLLNHESSALFTTD